MVGGARTDWNNVLIGQVICPAYRRLLEACKEKSFPSLDGITCHMNLSEVEGVLSLRLLNMLGNAREVV